MGTLKRKPSKVGPSHKKATLRRGSSFSGHYSTRYSNDGSRAGSRTGLAPGSGSRVSRMASSVGSMSPHSLQVRSVSSTDAFSTSSLGSDSPGRSRRDFPGVLSVDSGYSRESSREGDHPSEPDTPTPTTPAPPPPYESPHIVVGDAADGKEGNTSPTSLFSSIEVTSVDTLIGEIVAVDTSAHRLSTPFGHRSHSFSGRKESMTEPDDRASTSFDEAYTRIPSDERPPIEGGLPVEGDSEDKIPDFSARLSFIQQQLEEKFNKDQVVAGIK